MCVCVHGRVCVMDYCIYNKRVSVSMLVKTLHGGSEKQQVSLLKEDLWKVSILLLCADLEVI